MTEPPRPPGEAGSGDWDPTAPPPPPPASSTPPGGAPGPGYAPPPPPPPGGGYPPPPGGGYPPGGPQAGGFAQPAPGYGNADDRTFALIAHFGGAAGAFISGGTLGFVAPLIAYLAKGQQSASVRAHAIAALNFQLLWSIIALASYTISWCLLFLPTLAIVIFQVVVGILAGVKANEGQVYKYPLTYNFIK